MINPILTFIFGMCIGGILTFISIMQYAKHMEKKEKKALIKKAKEKYK